MAVPIVPFTEEGRVKSAKVVGVIHWICIIPAVLCLITALYIQLVVADKILFIENYNGAVLPGFLVFTGFFSLFGHILCGKAFWINHKPEKRETWAKFLLPAVIVTLLIFLFEMISGILCFVHVGELEDSLASGIMTAMKAYKNDMTTKEEMDVLQIEYECCGSRSYQDWFKVSWIHPDYMSGPKKRETDDVPFSCCTPHVTRPCIYHHVHDNDAHYNYDYRVKTTLYKKGCADKLMEFYENTLLSNGGAVILGLSFIQLIIGIVGRLIQTAVVTSMDSEDGKGDSVGYLFGAVEGGKDLETTTESEEAETTGDQSTFDTTFDSVVDAATPEPGEQPAYIPMEGLDRESEEPVYENLRPVMEDEEHIYHDDEVEQYLLNKYNNSKEYFEHLSEEPYQTGYRRSSGVSADVRQDMDKNQTIYDEPLPYPPDELENWRGLDRTSPSKKSLKRNSSTYVKYDPAWDTQHLIGRTSSMKENVGTRSQPVTFDNVYYNQVVPQGAHFQSYINNSSFTANNETLNRSLSAKSSRKTTPIKKLHISSTSELENRSSSKVKVNNHKKSDLMNYQSISYKSKPSNAALSKSNRHVYKRSSSNDVKRLDKHCVPSKPPRNDVSKNTVIFQYGFGDEFNRQYDILNQNLAEPLIPRQDKPLHHDKSYDSVGKDSVKPQVENFSKTREPLYNSIKRDKPSETSKSNIEVRRHNRSQRHLEFADFRKHEDMKTNIKEHYVPYGSYANSYDKLSERRASTSNADHVGNRTATKNSSRIPLTGYSRDTDSSFMKNYQTYGSTPITCTQRQQNKEREALPITEKGMSDYKAKDTLTGRSELLSESALTNSFELTNKQSNTLTNSFELTNKQSNNSREPDDFYIDSFACLKPEVENKSSEYKHTRTRSVSPIYPVTSPVSSPQAFEKARDAEMVISPSKREKTPSDEMVINLVPYFTPEASPIRKDFNRRPTETSEEGN